MCKEGIRAEVKAEERVGEKEGTADERRGVVFQGGKVR